MSRRACHLTMMDKNSLCKWNNMVDRVGKILQHITQSVPAEFAARRVARTTDEVGARVRHLPVRQQLLKFLPAALAMFALSACVSSEYMGISLRSGAAESELQALARRARAGDKQAQFELGIRYEEGRGVPIDIRRAKKLYTLAASDSGGTIWVYVPSPGNGAPSRVIPVNKGLRQTGLEEAKSRLQGNPRR